MKRLGFIVLMVVLASTVFAGEIFELPQGHSRGTSFYTVIAFSVYEDGTLMLGVVRNGDAYWISVAARTGYQPSQNVFGYSSLHRNTDEYWFQIYYTPELGAWMVFGIHSSSYYSVDLTIEQYRYIKENWTYRPIDF